MDTVWNGFAAVICDMDGTLINSEALHVQIQKQVCQEFGFSIPDEVWPQYTGQTIEYIFADLIEKYASGPLNPAVMILRRDELIEKAYPEAPLFPKAKTFLREVKKQGRLMALTTSTKRPLQSLVFKRHDLASFFDVIVTGDEVTKGKPDPEPYLYTVKQLKLDPEQCLVVEDSLAGVKSAARAGCFVLGITHSFSKELLEQSGANKTINVFDELL